MFNAELLRELRKDNRLTLKQVAEFAGVTTPYVSIMEKGKVQNPAYAVVESLAKLFRIDPHDFMSDEEPLDKEQEQKSVVDIMALREIRFTRKWTLHEAAERAGIDPSTLSLIENGRRRAVSMATLIKLAKAYGVDVDALLLRREEYVDLTALVMQSDVVIIDGEEINVRNDEAMERVLMALRMGAAWARETKKRNIEK